MAWGKKFIAQKDLSDTLTITHCTDGHWLWDDVLEFNLAVKAKTEEEAFVEALMYYQKRKVELEDELKDLRAKVDSFLVQFKDEYEDRFL